jgi:hypothetical protein
MANELRVAYSYDKPVYAVIERSNDNYVWDGSSFVVWNPANISLYAILLNSVGNNQYTADMPSTIGISPPAYVISYYEKGQGVSGNYSTDDLLLLVELKDWNGVTLDDSEGVSGWKNVFPLIIRNLINDTIQPYKFNNSKIWQMSVIAGIIVSQEFNLSQDYTFNMATLDIIPDPTDPLTYDPEAIALITLKAACMLSVNQYQTAVGTGIRVRDGDSEVDTTAGFKGFSDILKNGPCASYNVLLESLRISRAGSVGKAVLGPYSIGSYQYGPYCGIWDTRRFFEQWIN